MSKKYTASVITVSDRCSRGEREDLSGPAIIEVLKNADIECVDYIIVPDNEKSILDALKNSSDIVKADFILTTGGTGFSDKDLTPDATEKVIDKRADGIMQAIIFNALQKTSKAMLSRGIAGIRKKSIIINLPGSPKAVREDMEYLISAIKHGSDVLNGVVKDCGK